MSAKIFSRAAAGARGSRKQLARMRVPLALQLPQPAPRNHVALALAARSVSSAAGKHIRSQGAQRRAGRVALQQALRREWVND